MQILKNAELSAALRVIQKAGQPWFAVKDILEALGIGQAANRAVEKLDEDEVTQTHLMDSLGRTQLTYVVSESGLYALILRSDKPAAKAFRRWITSEVLPEIRQTGAYCGGWEKKLADLEADCIAARALSEEADERLKGFRRVIADRLGFSAEVLALPVPQTKNLPDGSKASACMIHLANMMPLPSKTKALVAWMMANEKIEEKAARQRLLRMYRTGLIVQGADRIVRRQTQEISKP